MPPRDFRALCGGIENHEIRIRTAVRQHRHPAMASGKKIDHDDVATGMAVRQHGFVTVTTEARRETATNTSDAAAGHREELRGGLRQPLVTSSDGRPKTRGPKRQHPRSPPTPRSAACATAADLAASAKALTMGCRYRERCRHHGTGGGHGGAAEQQLVTTGAPRTAPGLRCRRASTLLQQICCCHGWSAISAARAAGIAGLLRCCPPGDWRGQLASGPRPGRAAPADRRARSPH